MFVSRPHEVDGFLPRPVRPVAHCVTHRGYISRLSAVISQRRPLWRPLAAAVEGADSSASESVYLRRGGHPAERAGSGAWVGTPGPVDCPCLDERPPFQYLVNTNSRRVSSPRGVAQCLVPRKNPSGIFINIFFHILYPLAYACSMCACISLSSYSDTEQIQR